MTEHEMVSLLTGASLTVMDWVEDFIEQKPMALIEFALGLRALKPKKGINVSVAYTALLSKM